LTSTELRDKLRDRLRDRTSLVGVTPIIASITSVYRIPHTSTITVIVVAATAWGTVEVCGEDGKGTAQTETLTFTANGSKTTTKPFSKKITVINCTGFIAGTIEARIEYNDFDDIELDSVIDGAVQEYAKYKPKIIVETVDIGIDGYYAIPTGALWVNSILIGNTEIIFREENGKIKTVMYADTGKAVVETQIKIEYATTPDISEIKNTEMLLLCAEAFSDRIKSEEPDRWIGVSISVQGIDKLDVSTEFRDAAQVKMTEFRRQMGCGYGCSG